MMKRFALVFLAAVALQATLFAYYYDDLLYLRQPVSAIVHQPRATFERHATHALSRRRLTPRHLDTIASASAQLDMPALEVRALERWAQSDAANETLRLRLADALRRAGALDRAERLYLDLLQTPAGETR